MRIIVTGGPGTAGMVARANVVGIPVLHIKEDAR